MLRPVVSGKSELRIDKSSYGEPNPTCTSIYTGQQTHVGISNLVNSFVTPRKYLLDLSTFIGLSAGGYIIELSAVALVHTNAL